MQVVLNVKGSSRTTGSGHNRDMTYKSSSYSYKLSNNDFYNHCN